MTRRLSVVLDLDSGRFTAGMTGAAAATERLDSATTRTQASLNRIENRMRGLLSTTRDLTVILGQARTALYNLQVVGTGWLTAVIKTNAEMERMTFLLANMSDKLTVSERFEDAGRSLNYLFDAAKSAPFSINALTDSFVKMKAGGIDPTTGAMNGLVNATAAFGGNDQILHRASVAIQQMAGKGVISMEELRQQLGEAVPSAVALMARSMNMSYGELVDKVSKGQVEASSALSKMFGEFERTFGGSSQAMMDSFAGKMAVAKTTLIEFAMAIGGFNRDSGQFAEGSFMSAMKDQLQGFIDLMKTPEVALFANNLGKGLAGLITGFNQLASIVMKYGDIIIAVGKAFLLYFGAKAILGTLAGIRMGFTALTASLGQVAAGMRTVKTNADLATIALTLHNQRAATSRELLVAMGQAAGGVARGFAAMAGPIGIAVTLIWTAADAFGLLRNRMREATEASLNFREGFATLEDIKTVKDGIESVNKKIKDLEFERNRILKANGPAAANGFNPAFNQINKQLEELYQKRANFQTNLEIGQRLRTKFENERTSTVILSTIQEQTSKLTAAYNRQADEIAEARAALDKNPSLTDAQKEAEKKALDAQNLANTQRFYDQQIAQTEAYIKKIENQKNRLQQGIFLPYENVVPFANGESVQEQNAQLDAGIAKVKEYLLTLRDAARRGTEIAASPNAIFGNKSKDDDAGAKYDPVSNRLDTMRSRAAELTAELGGTSGELAKVNEQIENWGKAGVAVTSAQAEEFRKLASGIDATAEAIKEKNRNEQLQGRLTDQFERQTETAKELRAVLVGGYSEIEAEAAIFKIRLDQIVAKMTEGKEEAQKMADETAKAFASSRATEYALELQRTTEQINTGFLTSEQAAQARYEADVRRIGQTIDLSKFEGEERMRLEQIVSGYVTARRQQLARETEASYVTMLRSWQETTSAMNDAGGRWMDDFINGLVEGELSFKKFAAAILSDIAKIIIRAMVANAVLSAIGAVGGGGGASVPSAGNVGNILGSGGNNAAPTFHTGGMVGQKLGGSKSVSDAIFAYAQKFHQGGMVGLKPDERPAILQTGERVLSRAQTRAYDGAGTGMNVQVNIVNEGGQEMQEKSRSTRFDGEAYIIDIVTTAAGQPGKMRSAIKEAARN